MTMPELLSEAGRLAPDTGDPGVDVYLRDIARTIPQWLILDLSEITGYFYQSMAKLHMGQEMVINHRDEIIGMLLDYLSDDTGVYDSINSLGDQFLEDYPGSAGEVLWEMTTALGGVLFHQLKHFQVFRYNEMAESNCIYYILHEWLDPHTAVFRRMDKLDFYE